MTIPSSLSYEDEPSFHRLFSDAIVALILPMLPNVDKLTLGDTHRTTYLEQAIKRAKEGISSAISVTYVELFPYDKYDEACYVVCCFPAFRMLQDFPCLIIISGEGIGGSGFDDGCDNDQLPFKTLDVRKICLKDCDMSVDCLSNIINFSTGLTSFTFRYGGCANDPDEGIGARMSSLDLAKALAPHASTLEPLDLDVDSILARDLEQEATLWGAEQKEKADNASEDEQENKGERWT